MISIVVTSYTLARLADIRDLLDSIKSQSVQDFEVVYVVERSKELLQNVESMLDERGLSAKTVYNDTRLGLPESRNLGIKAATGEIIGFVDDDVVLDRDWCKAAQEGFESITGIAGATGPAYPLWVNEPLLWLPPELDWLIGCTRWVVSSQPIEVTNVWGMNMCFLRRALDESGRFLERSGMRNGRTVGWLGEDIELSSRIRMWGGRLLFLPGMKVLNKVYDYRMSNRYVLERSIRAGYDRGALVSFARLLSGGTQEAGILKSLARNLILTPSTYGRTRANLRKLSSVSLLAASGLSVGYLMNRLGVGRTEGASDLPVDGA